MFISAFVERFCVFVLQKSLELVELAGIDFHDNKVHCEFPYMSNRQKGESRHFKVNDVER
jgi:hypothetical protein